MTVSEDLAAEIEAESPGETPAKDTGTRARVRARLADTLRDGKGLAWLRTGWSDLAGSWLWGASPPCPRELWRYRTPDIERVPGRNRFLWVAWLVYNHLIMPVMVLAFGALWVLQHPARLLLAAVLAAPLIWIWS